MSLPIAHALGIPSTATLAVDNNFKRLEEHRHLFSQTHSAKHSLVTLTANLHDSFLRAPDDALIICNPPWNHKKPGEHLRFLALAILTGRLAVLVTQSRYAAALRSLVESRYKTKNATTCVETTINTFRGLTPETSTTRVCVYFVHPRPNTKTLNTTVEDMVETALTFVKTRTFNSRSPH